MREGGRTLLATKQSRMRLQANLLLENAAWKLLGGKSPSGLSKNVEAVVLALEKRGVVITEHGVEFAGKPKRP